MMLRALVELAEREKLVDRFGFEPRPVDFELRIDNDGRFAALRSLRDERGRGRTLLAPQAPRRSVNVCPGFLVDNARYVLGIGSGRAGSEAEPVTGASSGTHEPPRAGRALRCRAAFADLVRTALARSPDPALAAVVRFYGDFEANLAALLAARPLAEWTGGEHLAFSVEGLGFAHERPAARIAWVGARADEDARPAARCLVTGRVVQPARLHPAIRLPGGQSAGTSLISFNADAFRSHGLEQGANAPVAPEAAIAYVAALHRLLERDDTGTRTHRYGVRLGRDTVAVFWTTAPMLVLDFFADLWNGPLPGAAAAFHADPWGGQPPAELDQERFYAVTLGANGARVVVRDWFEAGLGQVKRSVRRLAADLEIAGDHRPLAIWQLLAAIDPPGDARLAPEMASRIFHASLRGAPLPRELLRHALLRLRSPDRERNAGPLLRARAALIKATLCGIARTDPTRSHLKEVAVSLDENSSQSAYSLGRLFAALERAQQHARHDPGVTLRDRYFAAASMAPASVFPRLLRLAQHDVSKARADGVDHGIEQTIGHIVDRLPASGFPTVLSLEDQGLFAVGYYHQRESFGGARRPAS
ncbi:MAG TPA: type I-C CRISPR-associated protein Cas8c/Csd1 [Kofleriaceae bacterium]|nr:type I-C CRISPR-associated protein Cas8c/Csd1 [Kofleriaceae bacterium]